MKAPRSLARSLLLLTRCSECECAAACCQVVCLDCGVLGVNHTYTGNFSLGGLDNAERERET